MAAFGVRECHIHGKPRADGQCLPKEWRRGDEGIFACAAGREGESAVMEEKEKRRRKLAAHSVRRSFTLRIFVTVLLMALFPLVLSNAIMLPLIVNKSDERAGAQAEARLIRARDTLEGTCRAFDAAANALLMDASVRRALAGEAVDAWKVYEALFSAAGGLYDRGHLFLYDGDGRCLYALKGAGDDLPTDWGALRRALRGETVRLSAGEGTLALLSAHPSANGGCVVYGFDRDELASMLSGGDGGFFLLNATGRAVYADDAGLTDAAAMLRARLLSGEGAACETDAFFYRAAAIGSTGFTLCLRAARPFTAETRRAYYKASAAMCVLCAVMCLWGAFFLSRHLSKPVRALSRAMGEAEKGNLSLRLPEDRPDELGRLAVGFNRMAEEYEQNLTRSVQRQKELNETRLRMMRAQLNPHFLYNTLDSMKWLGMAHDSPQVATLAANLALLLRASISGNEIVTLEEELELLERYADIQSIRFEDRFTCEIDVSERFQRCLVPKLILQPLVENAVIHALGERDDGYIKVSAEEENGELLLSVTDNGCGMPEALVEAINAGDARRGGGNLGIYNVDSIIKLHFGASYGLTASSTPGEGSRVCIHLPMNRREADA